MNLVPNNFETSVAEVEGHQITRYNNPGSVGPRFRVYTPDGSYITSFMPHYNGGPMRWGAGCSDKIPEPVRQFVETYAALLR